MDRSDARFVIVHEDEATWGLRLRRYSTASLLPITANKTRIFVHFSSFSFRFLQVSLSHQKPLFMLIGGFYRVATLTGFEAARFTGH